jgi:CheY-like chemotaxis protein
MSARGPILVVDDDDDIRDVVEMALRALGYDVAQAANGSQALAVMSKEPRPELVLLDLMMPDMDGEAVIAAMHRNPALEQIPVVLVTGHANARQKARELHVAGALVKPIQYEELASAVERCRRGAPPA